MQARTSVVNSHKCTSNEKMFLDWYRSNFDKGTRSIKVTLLIKVTPFPGISWKIPTKITVWYMFQHFYLFFQKAMEKPDLSLYHLNLYVALPLAFDFFKEKKRTINHFEDRKWICDNCSQIVRILLTLNISKPLQPIFGHMIKGISENSLSSSDWMKNASCYLCLFSQ